MSGFAGWIDVVLLVSVGAAGLVFLGISWPIAAKAKRIKRLEDAFPDFLESASNNLRAGMSLEMAIVEVSNVKRGEMGRMLKDLVREMHSKSLSVALYNLGQRSGSVMIRRVLGLIEVALDSESPMADVLDRVSSEIWSIHSLKQERVMRASGSAGMILWIGSVGMGAIIGAVLGGFSTAIAEIPPLTLLILDGFMILGGAMSSVMWGTIIGKHQIGWLRAPLFAALALGSFLGVMEGLARLMDAVM